MHIWFRQHWCDNCKAVNLTMPIGTDMRCRVKMIHNWNPNIVWHTVPHTTAKSTKIFSMVINFNKQHVLDEFLLLLLILICSAFHYVFHYVCLILGALGHSFCGGEPAVCGGARATPGPIPGYGSANNCKNFHYTASVALEESSK